MVEIKGEGPTIVGADDVNDGVGLESVPITSLVAWVTTTSVADDHRGLVWTASVMPAGMTLVLHAQFLPIDDGNVSSESEPMLDVVAVGEVLVDLVAPEAPDLLHADLFVRAAGGAPANVAVAAARLGARAGLVSAVGRDPFGEFLRQVLEENGVDLAGLQEVEARTTLALVARNAGGIPDFVFYRGADANLCTEDIPVDLIANTGYVHVSSMALLSEPSRSATVQAITLARQAGTRVSVDPNLRPSSWPSLDAAREAIGFLLEAADVLKVNDDEARILTGQEDLEKAARLLSSPDRLTVITAGAGGALWRWQGTGGWVPAPSVEVVETTGAGDAFVGAMLAELSRSRAFRGQFSALRIQDIEGIVRFASAAGAAACTQVGAMGALPTRADVEHLLAAGTV